MAARTYLSTSAPSNGLASRISARDKSSRMRSFVTRRPASPPLRIWPPPYKGAAQTKVALTTDVLARRRFEPCLLAYQGSRAFCFRHSRCAMNDRENAQRAYRRYFVMNSDQAYQRAERN